MDAISQARMIQERCAALSHPGQCGLASPAIPPLKPHPDIPETSLAVALLLWLIIGYLPQYFRIIVRQSGAGLSPSFLLIGTIGGVCGVGNIIALPSSQIDMGCCKVNARFACVAGLLGMVQIVAGFGFYMVLVGLYVYYTKLAAERAAKHVDDIGDEDASVTASTITDDAHDNDPEARIAAGKEATNIISITLGWTTLVMLATAVILNRFPSYALSWANLLGLTQTALATVQWLPQIWMTWRMGSLGSLSAVGLLIGTPGTFLFLWSIFMRVGWQGWSVWIVIVVIAVAQIVLLVLAGVFQIRKWRRKLEVEGVRKGQREEVATETTALLKSSHSVRIEDVDEE